MEKNGVVLSVRMVNLSKNEMPYEKCLVGGVDIESLLTGNCWPLDGPALYLPKGIQYGVAKESDIEAAYGAPSDTYRGELNTILTYTYDNYQDIELHIGKESGVLEEIVMRNYVQPKGFDEGSASNAVPDEVRSYKAPAQLGNDILSYNVMIEGKLYHAPFPVQALVDNGWSVVKDKSPADIASNDSARVTLRKGNSTYSAYASNKATYATAPENCFLTDIYLEIPSSSIGGDTLHCDWKLPGGIYSGMSQTELEANLKKNVKYYTKETHGDATLVSYPIFSDSAKQIYDFVVHVNEGKVYSAEIHVR